MANKILKELRKFGLGLKMDTKCPEEYLKYNNPDSHPIEPTISPRAWFQFVLDKFEKEKNGK